jgi:hypothetical protein
MKTLVDTETLADIYKKIAKNEKEIIKLKKKLKKN